MPKIPTITNGNWDEYWSWYWDNVTWNEEIWNALSPKICQWVADILNEFFTKPIAETDCTAMKAALLDKVPMMKEVDVKDVYVEFFGSRAVEVVVFTRKGHFDYIVEAKDANFDSAASHDLERSRGPAPRN